MSGRCECCDRVLSYKETTARFVTPADQPRRYVGICAKCTKEVYPGVPIVYRSDLPEEDDDIVQELIVLEEKEEPEEEE